VLRMVRGTCRCDGRRVGDTGREANGVLTTEARREPGSDSDIQRARSFGV